MPELQSFGTFATKYRSAVDETPLTLTGTTNQ